MCVRADFEKPEVTTRTTYAYKLVRHVARRSSYTSYLHPFNRLSQTSIPGDTGKITRYQIGERVTSNFDITPGFYCFASLKEARRRHSPDRFDVIRLLKVRIPKGTKIVRGWYRSGSRWCRTINAETIIPLGEV